ncbi:MAG: cobalamin B12-binding domain-containing protein [Deltaproteobacteria bacterium]|nr:cobalamin B12-binding domain-containing protein [Deltaproteobacteria bacterium]
MSRGRKKRILIAKPGLDGHDRGVKVVARALRNAGMEVIYAGLHQTPLQIVNAAIDEDVDAIGLSILSGAHNTIFPKIISFLKDRGASDILVFGGGTIPKKDLKNLKSLGIGEIFTTGTDTHEIIDYLDRTLKR